MSLSFPCSVRSSARLRGPRPADAPRGFSARRAARQLLERCLLGRRATQALRAVLALLVALAASLPAQAAERRCLSDCTPRVGIVSAFGQEADLLIAQTKGRREHLINGNRYTTGWLRGNRVVIVLSGISMINAAMTTQQMLDHFRIERLIMSGIAGGVNPAHKVGDVTVPDRWAMPMELYWNDGSAAIAACGKPGDVACLGLKLAGPNAGQAYPAFDLPGPQGAPVPTGLVMRENHVRTSRSGPEGEFRFDYPVDPAMLEVARGLQPTLERCGPAYPPKCMAQTPQLRVGGRGVSASTFLANPHYREYLHTTLQAEVFEMETAALAHVAYANSVPYIAFRSVSDLAGAHEFNADTIALFTSGLAEANEAAVTLAFLEAWSQRSKPARAAPTGTKP